MTCGNAQYSMFSFVSSIAPLCMTFDAAILCFLLSYFEERRIFKIIAKIVKI